MVRIHNSARFRSMALCKPGSIYHEPTPRHYRAFLKRDANLAADAPTLVGKDCSLVWEDGAGVPYLALDKSAIPFTASSPTGVFFRESSTGRSPRQYPKSGNLATAFYDLVERDGKVLYEHAGWEWDPKKVTDAAVENAYPDDGSKTLSKLFGLEYDAFGTWYEEDQKLLERSHVIDPYHRVDIVPSSRRVQVYALDGTLLVDTTRPYIIFETGLTNRYYVNRADIINGDAILSPVLTELTTVCPYKGIARYHNVTLPSGEKLENQVWTYPDPVPAANALKDLIAFWVPGPKFKLVVDGEEVKA